MEVEPRATRDARELVRKDRQQIERGIRLPHEDEVIVMAREYDAPELIEYYCKHVCAISAYCHKDK